VGKGSASKRFGETLCTRVLEAAAVGLVVTDARATGYPVKASNPAFTSLSGYSREIVSSWTADNLIGDHTPESVRAQVLAALRNGTSCRVITQQARNDGIPYWAELTLSIIHGCANRPEGHIWAFRDVTHQVALDELWRRYEFIVDTAGDLLALIGGDYTYTAVNASFANAFQLETAAAIGRPVEKIWGQASFREKLTGAIERCFAGHLAHAEGRFELPGLGVRYLDINYYPYRDSAGVVTHVVEVARDITQRKAAEDAVMRLNADLEKRVIERTARLQEVVRELDSFNYTVAHDLRTPLRALATLANLLRRECADNLPDQAHHYLTLMGKGVQQLDAMIDDLLRLSRLGRQPMKKTAVDLTSIVRQIADMLLRQYPDRSIAVQIDELPSCQGDPGLLREVALNLLTNAFKFTAPRKHARISVGFRKQKGIIQYFVKDNGIGFKPSEVGLLFTVFRRLDAATDYEGNGMGLAIVRRIVERHGGHIEAKGIPGRGAVFYFSLGNETVQ